MKVFFSIICALVLLSCEPYSKRVLYPLELKGNVENTWIDYNDHAIRVVVVNENDKIKEFYVMREENVAFYEKIQKGDSIFKSANSLEFYLKRDGKKRKYQFENILD